MPPPPRFCPFCRESFDDVEECPDHGVPLVPFEALPGMGRRLPEPDEAVSAYDPRFGRGWVFLGAAVVLLGAPLPFVSRDDATYSLLALASTRATNLWTVLVVAAAQVAIVLRRRTLERMRGARAAVPLLSLLSLVSVLFTLRRVEAGAEAIRASYGVDVSVQAEPGAYMVLVGALLSAIGGALLGRVRRGRR